MEGRRLSEEERSRIVEEAASAASEVLEKYAERGVLRDYAVSVTVSEDWPYIVEVEVDVVPDPLFERAAEKAVNEAVEVGFAKAREILSRMGFEELW